MTIATPFRAGGVAPAAVPAFSGPHVLLADASEFQPDINDPVYLAWSKAVIIRCAFGDQHDDQAWYGGQRRELLHQGGARFLGIYQYLVGSQPGAAQAQAFRRLVGDIQPGEVFIVDYEEGAHAVLTAWYNEMLAQYGAAIHPWLWTYTGLNFGAASGALPVEWLAAYQQSEPASPHRLWQFTSRYTVPGIAGETDCSVFHGSIDQLAGMAFQPARPVFGPPRNLAVRAGLGSVLLERCDPPSSAPFGPVDHYEVSVFTGSYPSEATLVRSYPRYMRAAPDQFGSLQGVPSGEHMTLRAVAVTAAGHASAYADVHFQMP